MKSCARKIKKLQRTKKAGSEKCYALHLLHPKCSPRVVHERKENATADLTCPRFTDLYKMDDGS